jgi:GDP-L-fucose synthase
MPTNLYGPNDNYDLNNSHVLPALIRKMHEAKVQQKSEVEIWGTGSPLREFLHVDDLARACLILLEKYDSPVAINVGSGNEISIMGLAKLISKVVGFSGQIVCNYARPNGTPRKFLDSTRILNIGWKPQVGLEQGIVTTYNWFLAHTLRKTTS